MAPGSAGREKLRAQSNQFRKEVIQIANRVYVAIGYSISNVVLIQGDRGAIILDTSSDVSEARDVRAAFGNLLDTLFAPSSTRMATPTIPAAQPSSLAPTTRMSTAMR